MHRIMTTPRRTSLRIARLAVGLVLLSAPALAHDLWLSPRTHTPATGESVPVALKVGHAGSVEVVPRKPDRVVRFDHVRPDGSTTPTAAPDLGNLAAIVRCDQAGLHQVVYRSNAARSELPAEAFNAYLKEEGLDAIIALRTNRGEMTKPSRERYSRSVKTLLFVSAETPGNPPSASAPTTPSPPLPVGLPLELNPQSNPFLSRPGDETVFLLTRDRIPVPGALVSAERQSSGADARPVAHPGARAPSDFPSHSLSIRTDEHGLARFRLTPGDWVVATVCMEPAALGADADWESTWASVSFSIP